MSNNNKKESLGGKFLSFVKNSFFSNTSEEVAQEDVKLVQQEEQIATTTSTMPEPKIYFPEFVALLHGDGATLGIIYQFVSDNLAWGLTCQKFAMVARLKRNATSLSFYGMRNFQLHRALNSTYYEKAREVTFYRSASFVLPVLEKFGTQLERIQLCHLPQEFVLPSSITLPQVTSIKFAINVKYNPANMIQQFVARTPKLKAVSFDFRIPKGDDTPSSIDEWLMVIPSIVEHVPTVDYAINTAHTASLVLFGNKLKQLEIVVKVPTWYTVLQPFENLQELRLSYRNTAKLTTPIVLNLPKLTRLAVSDFEHKDAQSEAILFTCIPVSVERLEVSFSQLLAFPDVQHLHNLSYLRISYTVIQNTKVPSWLASMTKLKDVNMSLRDYDDKQKDALQLTELPNTIKTFSTSMCHIPAYCIASKMLSSLDLTRTSAEDLQGIFAASPKLNYFYMEACKDIVMDASFPFYLLKMIASIRVSKQVVKSLSGMEKLSRLSYLSMRECGLKAIPKECSKLPYLKSLDLRANNISTIDTNLLNEDAGNFLCLAELVLAENPITSFPTKINLPRLNSIACSPLSKTVSTSELLPPVNINRKKWTDMLLQHMKSSRENSFAKCEGTQHVQEVYLDYAIACKQGNMVMICCHVKISETRHSYYDLKETEDDESEVIILQVDLNTSKVKHSENCWYITSLLKKEQDRWQY